jgi:hypothetical protein
MWGPENAEALVARDGHNWAMVSSLNGHSKEKEKV